MSDQKDEILPEQVEIIHSYAREYIQAMSDTKNRVGYNEGDSSKHFSFLNRYNEIAKLIDIDSEVKPIHEELREIIKQILVEDRPMRIRESAVGEGLAIFNFMKKLEKLSIDHKFEIYLNGLHHPRETISEQILKEIDELQNNEESKVKIKEYSVRDLTQPNEDQPTDLFILSNVHQYLTEEQFINAVENALRYAKIIAIHPIVGEANYPDTLYIYKTESGEIKKVIQRREYEGSSLGHRSEEN